MTDTAALEDEWALDQRDELIVWLWNYYKGRPGHRASMPNGLRLTLDEALGDAPYPPDGYLWREHPGRPWAFRTDLEERTFPADAEYVPVRIMTRKPKLVSERPR